MQRQRLAVRIESSTISEIWADGVGQLGGTGSGRGSEERIFHGADGGEVGCGPAIKQVELAEVG